MSQIKLAQLTAALIAFRDERNWAQFHTLKDLIISLNLEAAELLELTQWQSEDEFVASLTAPEKIEALRDECADVLLYLLLIAEKSGIDLLDAAQAKIKKNALKYPVAKSFGSRQKYTTLT